MSCGECRQKLKAKKGVMKAKMEMKIKKVQAKLDFLKEMQKIFG
jgi:hypothetical protein